MRQAAKLWISTLLSLGWTVAGAQAAVAEAPPPDVLAQREALARRLDRLAPAIGTPDIPDPRTREPDSRLSQWPNWGNWPNAWPNWRNW